VAGRAQGQALVPGPGPAPISFLGADAVYATSILPVPSRALPGLPYVSHVCPRMQPSAGAVVAVRQMMAANLFQGQPTAFTDMMMQVAQEADAAMRSSGTMVTSPAPALSLLPPPHLASPQVPAICGLFLARVTPRN
jgi:hypothetical protein